MSERAGGGRLPLLSPRDLTDAQRRVYDAVTAPPRGDGPFLVVDDDGHLAGPFNALLYAPQIGEAVLALGSVLRFGGTVAPRTRELVICAVAAETESEYEWYAHSRVGVTVGVSDDELDSLRIGVTPDTLSRPEAAALVLSVALARDHVVSSRLHAEVSAHYGHAAIVELTALVGYYRLLAGILAVAAIPSPIPHSP